MSPRQLTVQRAAHRLRVSRGLAAAWRADLATLEGDRNALYRAAEVRGFLRSAEKSAATAYWDLRSALRAGSRA